MSFKPETGIRVVDMEGQRGTILKIQGPLVTIELDECRIIRLAMLDKVTHNYGPLSADVIPFKRRHD